MVPDATGRFRSRPHYKHEELDQECESVIVPFLRNLHGKVEFPVSTDDLTKLIERDAEDLDMYADLSRFGSSVEGMTEFPSNSRPRVYISKELSGDQYRKNRLRTTLTHEFGHVHFHAFLRADALRRQSLIAERKPEAIHCKRETMIETARKDWMEWQAGYACGSLLMPKTYITDLVKAEFDQAGITPPLWAKDAHGQAIIDRVAEAFDVSLDAARVRLFVLGLLSENRPQPTLFNAV